MTVDLFAWLNRTLVPQVLAAFFALLLLSLLIQFKHHANSLEETPLLEFSINQKAPDFKKSLTIPLFGEYALQTAEPVQSHLAVKLLGVMYATEPSESQVLIQLMDGEERSYLIGDELPGGAIIKQIKPDRVFIWYQGNLEVLYLPKNTLKFDEPPKPLM